MAIEKRLIDVDALIREINQQRRASKTSFPKRSYVVGDVLTSIYNAPTVDAVEVVRCKDCKKSYKSTSSGTGMRCRRWGIYSDDCECEPMDFCSYGERRPDGQPNP